MLSCLPVNTQYVLSLTVCFSTLPILNMLLITLQDNIYSWVDRSKVSTFLDFNLNIYFSLLSACLSINPKYVLSLTVYMSTLSILNMLIITLQDNIQFGLTVSTFLDFRMSVQSIKILFTVNLLALQPAYLST